MSGPGTYRAIREANAGRRASDEVEIEACGHLAPGELDATGLGRSERDRRDSAATRRLVARVAPRRPRG